MKTKLCKMFVLFTVLCLSISSMTLVAGATTSITNNILTVSGENITSSPAMRTYWSSGDFPRRGTTATWTEYFSFSDGGACSSGVNSHKAEGSVILAGYYYIGRDNGYAHSSVSQVGYNISVNGTTYVWNMSPTLYTMSSSSISVTEFALVNPGTVEYRPSRCVLCGRAVNWTGGLEHWGTTASNYDSTTRKVSNTSLNVAKNLSGVRINNCTSTGVTVTGGPVTITGGTYKGAPAVSSNRITIVKGTIIDTSGNSQFILGDDSESSVTTSESQTITTVKLSNPPVIIDWADFPG